MNVNVVSDHFINMVEQTPTIGVREAMAQYFSEQVRDDSRDSQVIPIMLHKTHATVSINGILKSVSIQDFKRITAAASGDEEEEIPPICLPYGCFMFNLSNGVIHMNCYYPERISKITYDRQDGKPPVEFEVPFPNVILYFSLSQQPENSWSVTEARYFSTTKTVTQLEDTSFIDGISTADGIYRLPVSNMYSGNSMCFGRNTMPVKFTNNLRGLDYYYQILSIAPFNQDLGINGISSRYAPYDWFKFLHKKEKFPYDLLTNNR